MAKSIFLAPVGCRTKDVSTVVSHVKYSYCGLVGCDTMQIGANVTEEHVSSLLNYNLKVEAVYVSETLVRV